MTHHIERSRLLALAIGHKPKNVKAWRGDVFVKHGGWRRFDYRDPNVIDPIAKRYGINPFHKMSSLGYAVWRHGESDETCIENVCKFACIGDAVIEASERGLL